MHFYLPRRHRRKLLLPPGLLALAGLLWLGSIAVGTWHEKLILRSVVQLTMPPLHINKDTPFYGETPMILSPRALNSFRFWQDIYFNGQLKNDSINLRKLTRAVSYMQAQATSNNGIRVRFNPRAKYTDMVATLNIMFKYNVQKYWFDIKHQPTTFYTFTAKPVAARPEFVDFCGTSAAMVHYGPQPLPTYWSASYLTRIGHWLAVLWNPKLKDTSWYTSAAGTGTEYDISLKLETQYLPHFLYEFRHSEWRIQFLLIIGMAAISWWKIKR